MRRANGVEGIIAVGAGEQAEGEQQRQRAEARHQQIDVAGAHVLADPMMRDHQRPGGERHEFPRHQEAEGVVRHDDEVHGGEIGGIERQHALRGVLVAAIAEREQARRSAAEIDHHQEKCRQRVDAEMRAQPGQAERQGDGGGRIGISEQAEQRDHAQRQRDDQAGAIDHAGAARRGAERDRDGGQDHQRRHAVKRVDDHHLSRTPRPPPLLAAPSPINSMPPAASASTSFISESTLPRTTPSQASMRWMVGSDKPERLRQLALVEAEQRPGCPHLRAGYHVLNISIDTFDVSIDAYCGQNPDFKGLARACD